MRKTLIIILTAVGALLLLYPVVAIFIGNVRIGEISRMQAQEMKQMSAHPDQSQALLKAAREYNHNIRGIPILDPYLYQMTKTGSEEYQEYLATLPGDVMARLVVPSAKIDLPVRHGTEDDAIARGAGHLFGTGLPVGGKGVNAVLTAHSGMRTASLFDGLRDVKVGDIAYVQVAGKKLAYKVRAIHVIKPTQLELFHPVAGKDILTLFTCTPYGTNTHRLVVTAERIALKAAPPMNEDGPTWWDALRWWMILPILISAVGGTIVGRYLRKNRKKDDEAENIPDEEKNLTQTSRLTRTERAKKFRESRKRKGSRHSGGSHKSSLTPQAGKTSAKSDQASPHNKDKISS
ncbi:class C sortase [uncultured Varibaculum sp.]|uniref:class C sortase n=1 Tax=uncultured Varibaculum sp. TaxID=413896 RepID=UPI002592B35E|nr:class C sortase [uncultured Varibaculum sp.]